MAKKENYDELAKKIIGLVGGEGNISNVTHLRHRLRFNLKDESKADTNAIKGNPGRFGRGPRPTGSTRSSSDRRSPRCMRS